MVEHILITGGAGYLGRRFAADCMRAGHTITLQVHARGAARLSERRAELIADEPLLSACTMIGGDLSRSGPLAGCDPLRITAIVHAGAVTRFDVDARTAHAVNVEGTQRVLEFAHRCPRLRAVLHLSTLYASGLDNGEVAETWLQQPAGFANEYEHSKYQAEELVRAASERLPLRVLRVATVCADGPGGVVVQRGALHHALELLFGGLLAVIPGRPDTPLFLIDSEYSTRAARAVLERGQDGSVYNATHPAHTAPTLGELVELGRGHARARGLAPPYVEQAAFDLLRQGAQGFAGPLLERALESVAPFAPQLAVHKRPACERLETLLGQRAPDPRALARATVEQLAAQRRQRCLGGAA